jgi:hypothetical protein
MKRKILIFEAIVILLAMSLIPSGCSQADGHKTFTMKEGIARFSFEYSAHYKVKEHYADYQITAVHLRGPFNKEANDYTLINISIVRAGGVFAPNAESKISGLIKGRSGDPLFEFKVLEQVDLNIADIPAKLIAYQERDITRAMAGMYAKMSGNNDSQTVAYEVCREVSFVYNDLLWTISIDSDVSTAEAEKADFEHVLQTFKILE